jgi:hypothetical protein
MMRRYGWGSGTSRCPALLPRTYLKNGRMQKPLKRSWSTFRFRQLQPLLIVANDSFTFIGSRVLLQLGVLQRGHRGYGMALVPSHYHPTSPNITVVSSQRIVFIAHYFHRMY